MNVINITKELYPLYLSLQELVFGNDEWPPVEESMMNKKVYSSQGFVGRRFGRSYICKSTQTHSGINSHLYFNQHEKKRYRQLFTFYNDFKTKKKRYHNVIC